MDERMKMYLTLWSNNSKSVSIQYFLTVTQKMLLRSQIRLDTLMHNDPKCSDTL